MAGHGGTVCKQESDQNVLPITKALTKTTNCTCRAIKVERPPLKSSSGAAGSEAVVLTASHLSDADKNKHKNYK